MRMMLLRYADAPACDGRAGAADHDRALRPTCTSPATGAGGPRAAAAVNAARSDL